MGNEASTPVDVNQKESAKYAAKTADGSGLAFSDVAERELTAAASPATRAVITTTCMEDLPAGTMVLRTFGVISASATRAVHCYSLYGREGGENRGRHASPVPEPGRPDRGHASSSAQ